MYFSLTHFVRISLIKKYNFLFFCKVVQENVFQHYLKFTFPLNSCNLDFIDDGIHCIEIFDENMFQFAFNDRPMAAQTHFNHIVAALVTLTNFKILNKHGDMF